MASLRFLRVCALLQALGSAQAFAPPWTITQYFEVTTTTIPARTYTHATYSAREYTETIPVVPTVTSPRATTTITTTGYDDMTTLQIGLEAGQGTSSSYSYRSNTVNYYIPLTYTYPSSCSITSGPSTITTAAYISIPSGIESQITPTLTTTSTSTDSYAYRRTTYRYTTTMALLNPTDLPSDVVSSAEASNTPRAIRYCEYSSGSSSGSGSSSSGSGSGSSYDYYCDRYPYSCGRSTYWASSLALALIIAFSWFGLFFIIGMIESAVRFRNLMLGRGASRGLPKSFACLCPLLSCLFIICMHRGYRPKPKVEQDVLASNWKSMSFTAKLTLWLKYGFSRGYPPILGAAPPLATDPRPTEQQPTVPGVMAPLPQQMAEQPPVPGVMAPLPQQNGPQSLPLQTEQQVSRQLDNQHTEQQLNTQSTEQQPGAPQGETQYEPLPVPAPYQPLPTIAHSGNTALFEQPGQAVSPTSGNVSPIPHQSQPAQPNTSHEQHVYPEQPREVPNDTTDAPTGAPTRAPKAT
ncbi:uncharacterized protein GIQ15_02869 [Arthroderma uncinatum]|uniref:uncharacterized protein n=1 Tax=Arthroderma uncinatum TaxID=74035 RepID=UPI00144AEE36|nr:uncharacterized protein GIQ15_02869 [Arthroderma uncinatum]KAF3483545.1 hypothetical protein GIQ15_02869 [Arthroderma uncinatum]